MLRVLQNPSQGGYSTSNDRYALLSRHKLMPHQPQPPCRYPFTRLTSAPCKPTRRAHAGTLTFSDLGGRTPPTRASIALSFVSSFVRNKHALPLDIPTYITPYLPNHPYTVLFQASSSPIPSHPFTQCLPSSFYQLIAPPELSRHDDVYNFLRGSSTTDFSSISFIPRVRASNAFDYMEQDG